MDIRWIENVKQPTAHGLIIQNDRLVPNRHQQKFMAGVSRTMRKFKGMIWYIPHPLVISQFANWKITML
jgi:hypothetical protein